MQSKNCPKCKNKLPVSEFYKRPNGNYHSWCKSCKHAGNKHSRKHNKGLIARELAKSKAYSKERWKNSQEFRDKRRAQQLKSKYGITIEQYNEMLTK